MKRLFVLPLLSFAMTIVSGQDLDCVGDHHEGCPVLVSTEETRADPGCKAPQQISHGSVMWSFKGVLGRRNGDSFQPITRARVVRECLDEAEHVVRSCHVEFKIGRDGSFSLDLRRKRVDESLCRDDVLTVRGYEERVQLRFQADGCDDLLVRSTWPSPSAPLIMKCGIRK
jgi:hypothetical protein